ncbi:hypothetical protein KIPB_009741, partial [Kipferlia bialata]|eukprot:g9741.t1
MTSDTPKKRQDERERASPSKSAFTRDE